MFSGLTPQYIKLNSNTTTNGDKINICKFKTKVTAIDTFIAVQTALSTSTTTNYVLFRILNGGTTGNVTTRALSKGGGGGGAWVANTWREITTHYTFAAGESVAVRYSEQSTVAVGWWTICLWAVEGNV